MTASAEPSRLPRPMARLDAWANRLFGSRYNPLYQSGTIVVVLWLLLLVTGLWLLLYYRVGSPWRSVAGIAENPWVGRWIRGAHRYGSDAAVVATAVHALRMFLQRRTWGPRALAWVSGVVLLGVVLVSGWTGFVMVWDWFGRELAVGGARLLDLLPLFSEPIARAFAGDRPVGSAFFFLNLFLHVALPLGLGLVFWLHVSRLQRPLLLPPKALGWAVVAAMIGLAVVMPAPLPPEADPYRVPAAIPADWFYGFWLPGLDRFGPGAIWAALTVVTVGLILVPWLTRPRVEVRPAVSRVDSQLCTGCEQCAQDCPFEAITMVTRSDGRAELIAKIDPARCVGCGICAASCAPMGVGPAGRTGRDQLRAVEALIDGHRVSGRVVAFGCDHGAAALRGALAAREVEMLAVPCVGNVHTSAIEYLVRAGARLVLVLGCPPRDCWNREGPRWLTERVYHDREAELKARVERRRVAIAEVDPLDPTAALALIDGLIRDRNLDPPLVAETRPSLDIECEPVPVREDR
ncbi:MAG: hydrogenase iron-sulfur subunit [Gemmatimonadales bacterium]|nr:hydrogenase iron-sulfur subunit [Gemmatimonadales bacterium]